MKKLNFNNENTDDDEQLIDLLTTTTVQNPSEQFVNNTLSKFLEQKHNSFTVYKPLKIPLLIMSILGLFLAFVLIIERVSLTPIPNLFNQYNVLIEEYTIQMNSWYVLSPILLFLSILFIIQSEIGMKKHPDPI